ncbi:biotin--[acetyl-CoA-carboxylase] ligase [Mesorhizobium sp. NBSH29]|uniref:biotin--[acetyl-CoA-carboxylase] ligase n=1 Tax=Mesorhizobium sp. NBSH29 TaxID=2654249 RepID=UPI0018965AAB|nr:biotin--[acetyl-CoA-carboxylase] ligase [Mesorhizobium sp. NBSH29]QPC87477.1 biotin--[acetyl-CoA-carboxylase] ligase [Mesorhizobium sp. NBSH29]
MPFVLAPTALSAGFRLEAHDAVGSTNALALDRARAGDAGNIWIVSKKQEAGRGRRGRPWATPEGNLAASLLVKPDVDLKSAATLGFVAGLSLSDALDAVAPQTGISIGIDGADVFGQRSQKNRFELKWPNDVLASGAKLAGILLESVILADGSSAIVVGIGVNVVAFPPDLPYPATSLTALGAGCDAETLFLVLSDAWSENVGRWNAGRGLAVIRERWLARAAGLGGEVAVNLDGAIVRGTFETIDADCRFVIRQKNGLIQTIAAGDVHFGAVASATAT